MWYRIGDGVSSEATEHEKPLMVIENVDEDYVWYILLDKLEQEPVNINRESFERYLDTGYFSVVEKKEPIKEIVEEPATLPDMVEAPKPKPTLPVYNSHPEIPDSEKHNYRITDDNLGVGGAKEKFKRNMAAINLLHELEFENRLATPEEQEILAQYSLFASSPPSVAAGASAVTQVWTYIGELLFNMLVLVGTIKLSDRVVREMMGL